MLHYGVRSSRHQIRPDAARRPGPLHLLVLATSFALVACAADAPPTPAYHVEQGLIRDSLGRAVILRGVNLSGDHKRSPTSAFTARPKLAAVSERWGMEGLRFLVSWTALEPERGVYDEAYLTALRQRLDWAAAHGLLVVLDMHQDVYGEGFGGNGAPRWTCDEAEYAAHVPKSPWFLNYQSPPVMRCFDQLYGDATRRADFAAAWRRLAQAFADHPAVLGFDPLNEPHWGTHPVFSFERERLGPFYAEVVAAVRTVAPQWLAFLEPANSRNLGIPSSLSPFAFENVVYAPHSYDAQAEQGQGFDPQRRDALIANVAALAAEAKKLNAALWIGEYGGIAEDAGIEAYLDAQYAGIGAVAGSSMAWDYTKGGGYALLGDDGQPKPVLLELLARPYPRRVAGKPLSYAYDAANKRFELLVEPDVAITAPTVIAVPAVFSGGAPLDVECGGCTVTAKAGLLELSALPEVSRLTIAVTPRAR